LKKLDTSQKVAKFVNQMRLAILAKKLGQKNLENNKKPKNG
jgi:hypothetical protein